jgi:tetratricopeptide (TPR) repeat protein
MPKSLRNMIFATLLLFGLASASGLGEEPVGSESQSSTSREEAAPAQQDKGQKVQAELERAGKLLQAKEYAEAYAVYEQVANEHRVREALVGMGKALLRDRKVLERHDVCDGGAFQAEMNGCFLEGFGCCWSGLVGRQQKLAKAIECFEIAAQSAPSDPAIRQMVAYATVALAQFEEELACRTSHDEVFNLWSNLGSEAYGMETFVLPSLHYGWGEMYPVKLEPGARDHAAASP